MMQTFKKTIQIAAAAILLMGPAAVASHAKPYLSFGPTVLGGVIGANSPNYNSQAGTYDIGIYIYEVDSTTINDYYVEINGVQANLSMVQLGPNPIGGAVAAVPLPNPVVNVVYPVYVELREGLSDALIDVEKTVMYDLRDDPQAVTGQGGPLNGEVAFQITRSGISGLGDVHETSVPSQGAQAFEDSVLGEISAMGPLEREFTPKYEKESVNPDRMCVPVTDVPGLTSSPTYKATLAEAGALLLGHLIWKATAPPFLPSPSCVKTFPTNANFIACFNKITLTEPSFTPPQVENVEISLGAVPNKFNASSIDIGPMTATSAAILDDIYIYYDKNSCLPAFRPSGNVSPEEFDDPLLDAGRTCEPITMGVDGAGITGDGPEFDYGIAAYPERVDFSQATDSQFEVSGGTTSAGQGVCALNQPIEDEVLEMADEYYEAIETGLQQAWDNGDQASALESLFSSVEGGAFAIHPAGYDLNHSFTSLTHDTDVNGDYLIDRGMTGVFTSSISPVSGGSASYFYSPPLVPINMAQNAWNFFNNDTFDLSYTFTTGSLNQIVSPVGNTRLMQPFELQWEDTNLDPIALGEDPNQPVPLTSAILAAIDPVFANLNSDISITIGPTIQPLTWMDPDPGNIPDGRQNMTYEVGHILVDINTVDAFGVVGERLFQFSIDVIDPAFNLTFDTNPEPGGHFLSGGWSMAEPGRIHMLESEEPLCWDNQCATDLSMAVMSLVGGEIKQRMLDTIGEFPAPSYWDAEGSASYAVQVQQNEIFREGQVITLYGDLVPAGN